MAGVWRQQGGPSPTAWSGPAVVRLIATESESDRHANLKPTSGGRVLHQHSWGSAGSLITLMVMTAPDPSRRDDLCSAIYNVSLGIPSHVGGLGNGICHDFMVRTRLNCRKSGPNAWGSGTTGTRLASDFMIRRCEQSHDGTVRGMLLLCAKHVTTPMCIMESIN